MPYTIWQQYGDLSVADQNFDATAKYVDYLKSTTGSDFIRNQDTYGDWLNVNDGTANDLTSTAFFGWSADPARTDPERGRHRGGRRGRAGVHRPRPHLRPGVNMPGGG